MYDIVVTNDGTTSVFSVIFNEHYHSIHGARQESEHVFINAGLMTKILSENPINILEIGFGTGLNTLLTAMKSKEYQQKINYTAIELYPLPNEIYKQLNFNTILEKQNEQELFEKIYQSNWNKKVDVHTFFHLEKLQNDISNINSINNFDIIYYDAFSPEKQPELWSNLIFNKMYKALKLDGILVTYCAKGIVKRTLKSVGFSIETLPGPKGKREMIRAHKK